jgi:hypothetical protein
MKGINYLSDENGHKTAVVIDIQTYGNELQDFLDGLEAESRQVEPTKSFNKAVECIKAERQ